MHKIISMYVLEVCENSKYCVKNTKFFRDRDGYQKISRFSKEPGFSKELGFPKELEFGKGLGTSLNNSLKPKLSTISKGRRSRTIIRAIPSVISFGLTIFRVSFCTNVTNFISIQLLS